MLLVINSLRGGHTRKHTHTDIRTETTFQETRHTLSCGRCISALKMWQDLGKYVYVVHTSDHTHMEIHTWKPEGMAYRFEIFSDERQTVVLHFLKIQIFNRFYDSQRLKIGWGKYAQFYKSSHIFQRSFIVRNFIAFPTNSMYTILGLPQP